LIALVFAFICYGFKNVYGTDRQTNEQVDGQGRHWACRWI